MDIIVNMKGTYQRFNKTNSTSFFIVKVFQTFKNLKKENYSPALHKPVGGYTTESRPTATFVTRKHHCPLGSAKLYCLILEVHVWTTQPGSLQAVDVGGSQILIK